jgi:hypothetical protein
MTLTHRLTWRDGFGSFRRAAASGTVAGRTGPPSSKVYLSVRQRGVDYGDLVAADGSFVASVIWQGGIMKCPEP